MNIFTALRRAFSTGLIIRDIDGQSVKVIDTQRAQAYRQYSNQFSPKFLRAQGFNKVVYNQNYSINRLALYRDYDMMDSDPIISSCLDIYVYESFTKDEYGKILRVLSDNSQVVDILEQLFYNRLNCQFTFPIWFRNFVKYGDAFVGLQLHQKYGIINAQPISPYEIQRIEDDPTRPGEYYFKLLSGYQDIIQNYNIAHFRLLTDTNFLPYGRSAIEAARRTWKSLTIMTDAMMIYRIMRAPERRLFKVDVLGMPPEDVVTYMNDIASKMKKTPYRNPLNGQVDLRYNIQNITEDYFIPVRGSEDATNIQTLPGLENNFIDDINYLKNYMQAALKVPKAFVAYEQGIEAKATLSALDLVLSRYIQTLQKLFLNQLTRIALIHLFMLGYRDFESIDFRLELNNPSDVKKIQQVEVWGNMIDVAQRMLDSGLFSSDFIYKNIFGIPQDQMPNMKQEIKKDKKFKAEIEKIEQGSEQFGNQGEGGPGQEQLNPQEQQLGGGEEQQISSKKKQSSSPQGEGQKQQKPKPKKKQGQLQKQAKQLRPEKSEQNPLENRFKGGSPLHLQK